MDLSRFVPLPGDARLWIHGFSQKLGPRDQELIRNRLQDFQAGWVTHGVSVRSACEILFDRFAVTAAWSDNGVSGCSTDSFVRNFKELKEAFGLDGLNASRIYYRDNRGEIQSVDHLEFYEVVASGHVTPDTPVFDLLLTRLQQFRDGEFEKPFSRSWHARTYGSSLTGGRKN
ncbi:MAG: hypothetical protein ACRD1R_12660 [Acidobacteriota bacterium]